ncbi:MAG: hypothetical protein NVSMB68_12200 [Thermoanaerobaculia bacterium]
MTSSPTDRKQLIAFGVTISVAMALLALVRVWRRGLDEIAILVLVSSALFALTAFLTPETVAPIHRWWMRFAEVLSWINTRVLLILIFYLVVTPLGLVMRLLRRAPLDMARRDSYWTEPPGNSYGDRHYEKQF